MSLLPGSIVWVPFPFVDLGVMKSRPAVVVSARGLGPDNGLLWAVMVTGAGKARWPGDIDVDDLELGGLPIPSVVRTAKISTLEVANARRIGMLTDANARAVFDAVRMAL